MTGRRILSAAAVDWNVEPPLYTAPAGRRIVNVRSLPDKIVEVTLDNGDVVHVETGAPRFTTVH